MALALCPGLLVGCVNSSGSEPDDIVRVYKLKILRDRDVPLLSDWSTAVLAGDCDIHLLSIGENFRGVLLYAAEMGIISTSFHPSEQWFVYSSYLDRSHLLVVTNFGAIPRSIFSVPLGKLIHSISISSKGNRIAFLVEKDRRTRQQRLCVVGLTQSRGALDYLRDCGVIDIVVSANNADYQLIWDECGESVFWVIRDGRIAEYNVGTGETRYHAAKINRLLGVTEDAFLAARARLPVDNDHDLIWTLVSISRKTFKEKVISVFRGVRFITRYVEIPGTQIVAMNVVMQRHSHIKDCNRVSILFDKSKGVLLGRTEFFIEGFVKKWTDRNKKGP